jgi:hypothetical protein
MDKPQTNALSTDLKSIDDLVKDYGIDKANAQALLQAYGAPHDEAREIMERAKTINVTDESQVEDMAQARKDRLRLVKIRTGIEGKRKELKADYLVITNAIDGVAKYAKDHIAAVEAHLELQEKFAEVKAAERAAALKAKRTEQLMQYTDNISMYNLEGMEDATFNIVLSDVKAAYDARQAAAKAEAEAAAKAEQERVENEKRMAAENERLRAEAAAKAEIEKKRNDRIMSLTALGMHFDGEQFTYEDLIVILEKILNLTDDEFLRYGEQLDADIQDRKVAAIRIEAAKKKEINDEIAKVNAAAQAEREKREALERAERERVAAEEKAVADAAAAKRAAELAPDKDKIMDYCLDLEEMRTKLPAVESAAAKRIVVLADEMLQKMNKIINEKLQEL